MQCLLVADLAKVKHDTLSVLEENLVLAEGNHLRLWLRGRAKRVSFLVGHLLIKLEDLT